MYAATAVAVVALGADRAAAQAPFPPPLRAWNESWNDDKTKLNTSPSSNAAYRSQLMWLSPHAFVHAAAFASGKKCLDGKVCNTPVKVTQDGGRTAIEVE